MFVLLSQSTDLETLKIAASKGHFFLQQHHTMATRACLQHVAAPGPQNTATISAGTEHTAGISTFMSSKTAAAAHKQQTSPSDQARGRLNTKSKLRSLKSSTANLRLYAACHTEGSTL